MSRKERKKKRRKNTPEKKKIILKDYSKIILYYPLLIYSIIALIIQLIVGPSEALAIIWIFVFIYNTVAVGFNFSTLKFFLLFLSIIVIVLIFILLDIFGIIEWISLWSAIRPFFRFTLVTNFYGWIVLILGIFIVAALIAAQFRFIRIEKNEIYVRGIASGKANRYPTANIKIKMKIVDIFEYITIGAGSITLQVSAEKSFEFPTVPLVRRKKKNIDELLSATLVEKE
jgi:hypothetical protein